MQYSFMKLTYTRKNGEIFEFDHDDAAQVAVLGDAMLEDGDPRAELILLRRRLNETMLSAYQPDPTYAPRFQKRAKEIWEKNKIFQSCLFRRNIKHQLSAIRREYFPDKHRGRYFVRMFREDDAGLLAIARVTSSAVRIERFLNHPLAQMVYSLHIFSENGSQEVDSMLEEIDSILSIEKLKQVRELSLSYSGFGDEGARRVADSCNLDQLSDLRLTSNGLGDAGATALVQSPHLRNLVYLDLSGNELTEEWAVSFATSKYLPKLKNLDFLYGSRWTEFLGWRQTTDLFARRGIQFRTAL